LTAAPEPDAAGGGPGDAMAAAQAGVESESAALTVVEALRLRRLREARRALARKLGVAPARLIGEAALTRLAVTPPESLEDLLTRAGDETGLLARHGASLLRAACERD